jgi:hypothetical protein
MIGWDTTGTLILPSPCMEMRGVADMGPARERLLHALATESANAVWTDPTHDSVSVTPDRQVYFAATTDTKKCNETLDFWQTVAAYYVSN